MDQILANSAHCLVVVPARCALLLIAAFGLAPTAGAQSLLCNARAVTSAFESPLDEGAPVSVAIDYPLVVSTHGRDGLRIFDISDPTALAALAHWEGSNVPAFRGAVISGPSLFVGTSSGFMVFDISDPTDPQPISEIDQEGRTWDLELDGTLLYLARGDGYLDIYDVASPSAPVRLSSVATEDPAMGVSIMGTLAYVAQQGQDLAIFDVSNPVAPLQIGSTGRRSPARDVVVIGQTALVAADGEGLNIIDVSDPTQPYFVANYPTIGKARGLALDGSMLYLADDAGRLHALDVTDPRAPALQCVYRLPGGPELVGLAPGLGAVGTSRGFYLIDLETVPEPAEICQWDPYGHGPYVAADASRTLATFLQPVDEVVILKGCEEVGSFPIFGNARGLELRDGVAYVATQENGLAMFDVTDEVSPQLLGWYDTPSKTSDIAVDGDLVYLCDIDEGLYIIDVSVPALPRLLSHMPGRFARIELWDEYAVVKDDGTASLMLLDVSAPSAPVQMSSYPLTYVTDMLAHDGYLYVASSEHGLNILDISDPWLPSLASHADWRGDLGKLARWGTTLFVHVQFEGVRFVDITDPRNPVSTRGMYISNTPSHMVTQGGRLHIRGGDVTLQVFSIADCPPCPADLNSDGIANTRDVIVFLNEWQLRFGDACSQGDCRADIDQDGDIDTRDLILFLDAWHAGC